MCQLCSFCQLCQFRPFGSSCSFCSLCSVCQFCQFARSCIFSFAKNNLIRYVGRLHLHMSTQAHSLTHIGTEAHRLTDTWYRHHPSTERARFRFVFYEMAFVRSHFGSSSQLLGFHTRFHSWTGFTPGFIVTCSPRAILTSRRTGAQFANKKKKGCWRYQCTPTLAETSDS